MTVDESVLVRMRVLMEVLESAVTAALPIIKATLDFRERQEKLTEIVEREDDSMVDEFFEAYRDLSSIAGDIEPAKESFQNALTVLGLDLESDYGISVSLAATMIAHFVTNTALLSGRHPEEVWQEYVFRESSMGGFTSD